MEFEHAEEAVCEYYWKIAFSRFTFPPDEVLSVPDREASDGNIEICSFDIDNGQVMLTEINRGARNNRYMRFINAASNIDILELDILKIPIEQEYPDLVIACPDENIFNDNFQIITNEIEHFTFENMRMVSTPNRPVQPMIGQPDKWR